MPSSEPAHDGGDRRLVAALLGRMVPEDDWPGALGSGTLEVFEHRLGQAELARERADLEAGLAALEREGRRRYGVGFAELAPDLQDRLLEDVDAGRVEGLAGGKAGFVERFARLAAEAFYARSTGDPRGALSSWAMIGYRDRPGQPNRPIAEEPPPRQRALGEIAQRYDAVIVGAGAGGGVAAAVAAEAGLRVLLVERGAWLSGAEIGVDHLRNHRFSPYGHNTGPSVADFPRTLRVGDTERLTRAHERDYHNNAMTLGGGTRVFGAQAWRFFEEDFTMASCYGVPEHTSLADWPIRYEDLAPDYERAEWELGVAGAGDAHRMAQGPRARGYPMAPFPPTEEARRLSEAAQRLGWEVGPPPLLINTVALAGRAPCERCGQCVGFACPVDAKNGTHNTVIPRALRSGRCDLVTGALVERILVNSRGVVQGVSIVDATRPGLARRRVTAGHVVCCAGAIETARLLLLSASDAEPDGLGNASDQVGRHLQGHVYAGAYGRFDDAFDERLGPGPAVATCQFAHHNRGVIGGGMLANEFVPLPITFWAQALPPGTARWGAANKEAMRHGYRRTVHLMGPAQEIPMPESRVRLSPTVRDRLGLPVAMLSGSIHPESARAAELLSRRATEWLHAAGAREVWSTPVPLMLSAGQHQAGTARMGTDPMTSVTDPTGRVHGHRNLWVADASLHVTNGAVNPVLTVLALAFRVARNVAAG